MNRILLLMLTLVLIGIGANLYSDYLDGKKHKTELSKQEQIITDLKKQNKAYDLRIKGYQQRVAELDKNSRQIQYKVDSLTVLIINLRKRTNEKHAAISKYSTADIEKFWTDRYKDSLR